jgi:RES domain
MAIHLADPAHVVFHRIGRLPDPLAWPPPAFRGAGRFDDPENEFGVIYAAPERRACFLETLDAYRPDRALLQRLLAMGPDAFIPQSGLIPDAYFDKRIGHLRLDPGQRWLDLRMTAPGSAIALSRDPDIAALLPALGYGNRVKPGDFVGSDRSLTQALARWAYERDYAGLAYSCSHDLRLDCWAIFSGARFTIASAPSPIEPDDLELIAVARTFELTVSFAGRP